MTPKDKTTSLTNITLAIALCLVGTASTAFGQASSTRSTDRPKGATLMAAATPAKTSGAATATDNSAAKTDAELLEEEVSELRGVLDSQMVQLKEQQQRIQALEDQLKAPNGTESLSLAPSAPAPVSAGATLTAGVASPASMPATAAVPPQAAADVTKQIEDRVRQVGPFTFSGDIRLREEPFFGGPANMSQDRNRIRARVRFNVNARLNSDIAGGFTMMTGDVNQQITGNQTLNQQFTRKPFYLDKMFLTYTPHQFKPFSITGGKFAYTWLRTELTWDNDLSPEGVSETLNFNFAKTPIFKRLTVVGFQLPFGETAGFNTVIVDPNNQSIHQSVVYGGQVQTVWQLTKRVQVTAAEAFYNYHNADSAALAYQTTFAGSPDIGLLKLSTGNLQNNINVAKNAAGTITNAQFASKYALADSIVRFDFNTGNAKLPLQVTGDYVQNTKACANVSNFFVPSGSTATLASCDPHQRNGIWIESRFGRIAQKGDFQLAYTRMLIQKDAVMNATNFDDMRASSNVTQHRLEVFYNVHRNVRLQFTGLFGRLLNAGVAPGTAPEPILDRLQFDVLYTF